MSVPILSLTWGSDARRASRRSSSTPATAKPNAFEAEFPPRNRGFHVVRRGRTLSSIAHSLHSSPLHLAAHAHAPPFSAEPRDSGQASARRPPHETALAQSAPGAAGDEADAAAIATPPNPRHHSHSHAPRPRPGLLRLVRGSSLVGRDPPPETRAGGGAGSGHSASAAVVVVVVKAVVVLTLSLLGRAAKGGGLLNPLRPGVGHGHGRGGC